MEKRKISSLSRLLGILLGITLSFAMGVLALVSVITTDYFWLEQNDRYGHKETLNLVSNDDYNALFHSYIEMFKGNEDPEKTDVFVNIKGNPEDFTDTFVRYTDVFPQTDFSGSLSFDQKYFDTLKELYKVQYGSPKDDFLKGKMYLEISCPVAFEEYPGVNIKSVTIKDKNATECQLEFKTVSVEKNGSVKYTTLEEKENILFEPKSNSTKLRAYILNDCDLSRVEISIDFESLGDDSQLYCVYSYEQALTKEQVAEKIGPEAKIVAENERLQLISAGNFNNNLKLTAWIGVIIAVLLIIYAVKKQGREAFFGIGVYTVTVAVIFIIVINVLVHFVPSEWGFLQFFDFNQGSTSSVVMGQGFMNDFALGAARFYDFVMLMPLFVGYVLIKLSKKKHFDPNEDYLYQ